MTTSTPYVGPERAVRAVHAYLTDPVAGINAALVKRRAAYVAGGVPCTVANLPAVALIERWYHATQPNLFPYLSVTESGCDPWGDRPREYLFATPLTLALLVLESDIAGAMAECDEAMARYAGTLLLMLARDRWAGSQQDQPSGLEAWSMAGYDEGRIRGVDGWSVQTAARTDPTLGIPNRALLCDFRVITYEGPSP